LPLLISYFGPVAERRRTPGIRSRALHRRAASAGQRSATGT